MNEIAELNQIRLDEDLSYTELADLIGTVDASVLHRLLNDPDHKPYDRTLHKIRKFLDTRKGTAPKSRRQRAAS